MTEIRIDELMADSGVGFGTSGARGLVSAMTDRVCYAYTAGFLILLQTRGAIAQGGAVAIAGDLRASSPRMMRACAQAIADLGFRAINCGAIPTPALAAFTLSTGAPGLMVTGSHIPDDRNGIKFYLPEGELLKGDEAAMRAQQVALPEDAFTADGALRQPASLATPDPAARNQYRQRYVDALSAGCLAGCRVLVYEHSSVARDLLREIPAALGAEVICRGRCDNFVPVDTEAVRPEDVALARDWADTQTFDIILSADGDGDRPLIGDELGEWLRGDLLGILTAGYLGADRVVTPVSTNTALERSGWFPATVRTRIGSPYVIEGMRQAVVDGGRRVVGFEANGGFLTEQPLALETGILPALPTRDAVIVGLAVLLSARARACRVSELARLVPRRFTASDRLQAFPGELSRARIADLVAGGNAAIEAMFGGLGRVRKVDRTDGLRITFDNDEIVHLRPSGNAPELRCYNEADSAARAKALNVECLERMAAWRDN